MQIFQLNKAVIISRFVSTRVRHAALLFLACAGLMSIAPAGAAAVESYALPTTYDCGGRWSGGNPDADGTLYIVCSDMTVRVIPRNGPELPRIPIVGGSVIDIAPSPNGQSLYAAAYTTEGGLNNWTIRKFDLINGSYQLTAWRPEPIPYGGRTYVPQGRYVATDALGNVYFGNGLYPTGDVPTVVTKHDSTGKLLAVIGGQAPGTMYDASTYTPGLFWKHPVGVAASRDGSKLYVAESGNGRIQRFDLQANGQYRYRSMWGNTQATDPVVCTNGVCERRGSCEPEKFGVPYDLSIDPWGYVYAINSACERVHKYDPDGNFVGNWYLDGQISDGVHNRTSHSIAVDGNGNIYVGEVNRRFMRTTPLPGPFPAPPVAPVSDVTPPTLTAVTVPNPTAVRTFTVNLTATDNVGIAQMRVTNDSDGQGHYLDIDAQPWVAYQQSFSHTIHAIVDTQGVIVQLRDAAGNESNVKIGITRFRPEAAGDVTAPVLTTVAMPDPTSTQSVTVTLTASDNVGLTQMRATNSADAAGNPIDINSRPWVAYQASFVHVLRDVTTAQSVLVQVRDAAGNVSAVKSGATTYAKPPPGPADVSAPVIDLVSIVDWDPTTLAVDSVWRQVRVSVAASDDVAVTQMRVANEDADVTEQAWRAYATPFDQVLTAVADTKAVLVQVRDAAGNISVVKRVVIRCVPCADKVPGQIDRIGTAGDDSITGEARQEFITGLAGNDTIDASQPDGTVDVVHCGAGTDSVRLGPGDFAYGCETVVRVG